MTQEKSLHFMLWLKQPLSKQAWNYNGYSFLYIKIGKNPTNLHMGFFNNPASYGLPKIDSL